MGATGHCLYRRLWPSGAGSNLWRALIGSWVMPPSSVSIEIERGGEKNISATAAVAVIVVVAATATATAMVTAAATAIIATRKRKIICHRFEIIF